MEQQIAGKLTFWKGITSLMQNAGAFLGIYAFARVTHRIGRRPAFAISFVLAAVATAVTFWFLDTFWQIFVLIPIMGFCQLSLFGGYAIYFPELFPTRLRSTGTSFCYNVGRLVAAAGPSVKGLLTSVVFAGFHEPMRYAGSRDVLGLSARAGRPAVRTRNPGPAAARMKARAIAKACAESGGGVSLSLRSRASRKVCSSNLRSPRCETVFAQKSTISFKQLVAVFGCHKLQVTQHELLPAASCPLWPVIGAFSRSISTVLLTTSFRPTIEPVAGKDLVVRR